MPLFTIPNNMQSIQQGNGMSDSPSDFLNTQCTNMASVVGKKEWLARAVGLRIRASSSGAAFHYIAICVVSHRCNFVLDSRQLGLELERRLQFFSDTSSC
jgi:hypothetical protein